MERWPQVQLNGREARLPSQEASSGVRRVAPYPPRPYFISCGTAGVVAEESVRCRMKSAKHLSWPTTS